VAQDELQCRAVGQLRLVGRLTTEMAADMRRVLDVLVDDEGLASFNRVINTPRGELPGLPEGRR
jgi:hypothetical protein